MRIDNGGRPSAAHRRLSREARPHAPGRAGALELVLATATGAPKKHIRASPMNLSRVPRWASMMSTISLK